ncbi:hypothetical protein FJZ26_01325 [Candidatus Parvarchaeota archaeon]|nr:hypothetical protein [Candidatus Parvarchaeota archaeon]
MRKISFNLIAASFFITALIFIAGIFVGKALDKGTVDEFGQSVLSLTDRVSASTAIMLLDSTPDMCPLLESEQEQIENDVNLLGYKISFLEDTRNIADEKLKGKYMNLQLNSYLLSNKVKQICSQNFTSVVMFYSSKQCTKECKEQETELFEIKKSGPHWVKIYSFDAGIGSASVQVLANKYRIEKYPTILIEDKKYEGLVGREKLEKIIGELQS